MNKMKLLNICTLALFVLVGLEACKQVPHKHEAPEESLQSSVVVEKPETYILDSFDIRIKELKEKHHLPGVSFAFITQGKLQSTRHYGKLQKSKDELVNDKSIFSVGSISKVVNACLILKLVALGKLDLDVDVNDYLLDYEITHPEYSRTEKVTLRRILSHTAGLSVHGFPDYLPGEPIPSTVQTLMGEAPAKNDKVELIHAVGSKFKYSGGGVTVSQKVVEDVTGLAYHEAAQKYLFEPLGLLRSSYENPLPSEWGNIAKAHNDIGNEMALPRGYEAMPEAAASGLWTTPTDLAKILIEIYDSYQGTAASFFPTNLMIEMTTKCESSDFGLGPEITLIKEDKVIQHGGANDSYKAYFCFYFEKGFGYVVTTNGSDGWDFIMDNVEIFDDEVRSLML